MNRIRSNHSCRLLSHVRAGAATVEAAVCFPVLVLVALSAIEINNQFYLRRSLTLAAYEAARLVPNQEADSADVLAIVQQVLNQRNVSGYTVTLSPGNLSELIEGDEVTIVVSADKTENQLTPFSYGSATMTVHSFAIR